MSSVIKLKSVKKIYPMGEIEVQALRGVDLEIDEGNFVAIIGPSGSGKSTLMHLIGLLDTPTEGDVFLQNKNVSKLSSDARALLRNKHIGFVFQQFNLLSRTSALDNVALPLLYAGVEKRQRDKRARRALELVGLGDRLDHTSSQLSGGQQQRVAIARALVNNPTLILADEPTGNLDTTSGQEIMHILSKLNKEGNTIVLVTHELDIAKGTKRTVELIDGKIASDMLNGKD
ncbi:MAG: ABC transporter ATP-binding protein [Candidatus Woesebacteria bacterium]|jgi:putative ABC transport system ATP-binding protein